jgi:hypothetical protein
MPLKTVIVIGAGASYEFGLPVGEELKKLISSALTYRQEAGYIKTGDGLIYDAIRFAAQKAGETPIRYMAAANSIADGLLLTYSIDNYLNNHRGDDAVEMCGKLGIVRSIIAAEERSKLYAANDAPVDFQLCEATWAVRLVRALTEQCTVDEISARLSSVTFIVFNYDRCLEHVLMHAFSQAYRIGRDKAADIVNGLAIYHPYGRVGKLPWMKAENGEEIIEYGGYLDPGRLYRLARGIKTFTEGTKEGDSDILAIRESVRHAERFVFLGYAYHKLNMQLMIGDSPRMHINRQGYGTAYRMSEDDRQDVVSKLSDHFNGFMNIRNVTCHDLFYEFSRALSFT